MGKITFVTPPSLTARSVSSQTQAMVANCSKLEMILTENIVSDPTSDSHFYVIYRTFQ